MTTADNRKPKRPSFVPNVVRLQRRLENLTRNLVGRHSTDNGSSSGNGSDIGDRSDASADTRNASKLRSGDKQMRFLAYSVRLEESGTPLLARCAIVGAVCLISALITWSAFTKISEVAAGPGQVVPLGKVKVVQHLEGGIVEEILVREGALVNAGDVMVRLEKAGPLAELEQVRAREAALRLVAERLQAFANGKPLAPLRSAAIPKYRQLVKDQLAILDQQIRTRINQRKLVLSQIKQREAEIDVLEKRGARLEKEAATVGESFEMRRRLFRKRVISRTDYLKSRRDFERISGELVEVRAIRRKAREALIEAKARMTELEARRREEALTERGKVTAELAQVREKLKRFRDRVRRLEIRAPIQGYVKGLKSNTVGGVISAGAPIMEIVPVNQELIIESRITTRDIGHVRVGQRVRIKFDTYDHARYGIVYGRLRAVSATTFQEKGNPPYYRGTVSLDRRFVGRNPKANPILAGMTIQAEIVTGSKSLLAYLLKPIQSVTDGAFRER